MILWRKQARAELGQAPVKLEVRVEESVEVVVKAGPLGVWSDQIILILDYKLEFHYSSGRVGGWMGWVGVIDVIIGTNQLLFFTKSAYFTNIFILFVY